MQNKKSAEQVQARRLKPIYDSIDAAQYKKAIVEADKVLKKHPQTCTAKVLKALAYIRIDKSPEALPLLTEVEGLVIEDDSDENTIQALCHCYKELNNPEKIVELYSSLVRRNPSEEKLRDLFIAHVRTRNFRQQQQVAMQLFKDTKILHYYCWALISILIQGYADNRLGRTIFFPLAEKMLEKLAFKELHEMHGGLDLHLLVLESRERFADAMELIESKLTEEDDTNDFYKFKQRLDTLCKLSGNNEKLMEKSLEGIQTDPNEWINWMNLAESAIANINKEENESSGQEHRKRIIDDISTRWQAMDKEGRGPLLGRLLLISKFTSANALTEDEISNMPFGTALSAFESLAIVLRDKPFAFCDMKPFLHLLEADQMQKLLDHVASLEKDNNTKEGKPIGWSKILWEQLTFHFHPPRSLDDDQLRIPMRRLCAQFENAFTNRNVYNGLQITAMAHLVVQYFWEYYKRAIRKDVLIVIISFIEWICTLHEDCSASILIILCRLYGIFGDVEKIEALERQMQLKFIQRDSLAFLHFFVPYQFGQFKSANIYFTSLGAMYEMNEREINECLVASYKNNNFLQIQKLMEFTTLSSKSIFSLGSDVLNHCVSGCFAVNMTADMDLVAATLVGSDGTDWQNCADNRDFSVIPPIVPDEVIEAIRAYSLDEMRCYFKLKQSLMSAIGHIGTEKLKKNSEVFFEVLEQCKQQFGGTTDNGMDSQLESFINLRLHSLMTFPRNELFMLATLTINTSLHMLEGLHRGDSAAAILHTFPPIEAMSASLETIFDQCNAHKIAELDGRLNTLLDTSAAIEMLAICLVGFRLMEHRAANNKADPMTNGGAKQEKQQQNRGPNKNPFGEAISARIQLICQTLKRIRANVLANMKKHIGNGQCRQRVDDNCCEELINELPKAIRKGVCKMRDTVLDSINEANCHSIDEMNEAIDHLLKHCC